MQLWVTTYGASTYMIGDLGMVLEPERLRALEAFYRFSRAASPTCTMSDVEFWMEQKVTCGCDKVTVKGMIMGRHDGTEHPILDIKQAMVAYHFAAINLGLVPVTIDTSVKERVLKEDLYRDYL